MKGKSVFLLGLLGIFWGFASCDTKDPSVVLDVDYKTFISRHDMIWDRTPDSWTTAPFSGNGNVGFLLYQVEGGPKNNISLHIGRHDYYDHRLPYDGQQMLWIYRARLPLGHFNITSKGEITSTHLRLGLWDAELSGTITTSVGSYEVHALTHTNSDIIYFQTDAKDGEAITITWHPEEPYSPVRRALNKGEGPKAPNWTAMRNAPYPLPPKYILSKKDNINFCFQELYDHRGETTTAWEIIGDAAAKQILTTSTHHSFPEDNSREIVTRNLRQAREMLTAKSFFSTHRAWWNNCYSNSFLTLNDPEKEAFYWIQMYKFASATRGNGPILDLMGPWYNHTFWPMVWGDLNVQLIYWTHLTANRLEAGESLVNNIDKYKGNLLKNAPSGWEDCATLGALFPQDMDSERSFPDMLVWLLHDYWLHCEYAGDRERMRDGLFPILRQAVNSYLHYFKENPVDSEDGKIHVKNSWSPEYKPGHGQDINFTLALIRWGCNTLIDLDKEFGLADPLSAEWQYVLDNLVEYQVDENGLRIGKDIAFTKPHRHYSHLLGFYPLAIITPETPEDKQLLRTSLDHWLEVTTTGQDRSAGGTAVTGYTCTGAASMYAWLGDGEKAYEYLDMFINNPGVAPTTMYAEVAYNPVIESPFSYATAMHEMVLQSWGGTIRVFAGIPEKWDDIAFKDLRTQGAFLVSAKRKDGETKFVSIESLKGEPCVVQVDIANPKIYIDGKEVNKSCYVKLDDKGLYNIDLEEGESVIFTPVGLSRTDLSVEAVEISKENYHLFGLNKKTERLPGYQKFYIDQKGEKWQSILTE